MALKTLIGLGLACLLSGCATSSTNLFAAPKAPDTLSKPSPAPSVSPSNPIEITHIAPAISTIQLWFDAGAIHEGDMPLGVASVTLEVLIQRLGEGSARAALAPLEVRVEGWVQPDAAVIAITGTPDVMTSALRAAIAEIRKNQFTADEVSEATRRIRTRSLGARDRDQRIAWNRLLYLAYGSGAAVRPVLPFATGDISEQQVARFHAERYLRRPPLLIISTPRETASAMTEAKSVLSTWPANGPESLVRPGGIPPPRPSISAELLPPSVPSISLAFSFEAKVISDVAHADLLSYMVAAQGGRLDRIAKVRGIDVLQRSAFTFSPLPSSQWVLTLDVDPSRIEETWPALLRSLFGLAHTTTHGGEVAEARRLAREALMHGQSRFDERVTELSQLRARWGIDNAKGAWLDALERITPQTLRAFAKRVLSPSNMAALINTSGLQLEGSESLWAETLAEQVRASHYWQPEQNRPGRTEPISGIDLVIQHRAGTKSVAISAWFSGGTLAAQGPYHGMDRIAAALLETGPGSHFEIGARTSLDAIEASLEVPAEQFEAAIAGLFESIERPEWSRVNLKKPKVPIQTTPALTANRILHKRLQQRFTGPTTHNHSPRTPARVRGWFKAFVTEAPTLLVVVGDVEPAQVRTAINNLLSARRTQRTRTTSTMAPTVGKRKAELTTSLITQDGQAAWSRAYHMRGVDENRMAALEVLNFLFENPELAMSVRPSALQNGLRTKILTVPDGLVLSIAFQGPAEDVRSFEMAINTYEARLKGVILEREVLEKVAKRIARRRDVATATNSGLAHWLGPRLRFRLPFTGPHAKDLWRASISRVTAPDVQAMARELFTPENTIQVEVSPPAPAATPISRR